MNLGHQYGEEIEAKNELLKAYEQCIDISMDKRAKIENFLKIESELDYEMQSALFRKAAKLEKQIRDKLDAAHLKGLYKGTNLIGSQQCDETTKLIQLTFGNAKGKQVHVGHGGMSDSKEYIDPVKLEKFSSIQVKRILTYSLGYDENSVTFLYLRKPNCSLDSGLVPLADALQDRNMLLIHPLEDYVTVTPWFADRADMKKCVYANKR
ncbi:hypothetical protein Tco_0173696 [Tanacetum coccineum]